ncbi:helix-turn-helix domain-containing protein [Streptomyces sp. BR123]|uniref:helix-turn-helix domain-containing protein n=1 Tax=Streptomyces sp. BR123 TaxID=2749828 RepID=UPI0015C45D7D|nr:helix-turn-helix domain-containing protein [Streptomyces sp. BR123]NXY96429.1 helix-turn-helix domain-containing protein [Streptomyces sp. BR123]
MPERCPPGTPAPARGAAEPEATCPPETRAVPDGITGLWHVPDLLSDGPARLRAGLRVLDLGSVWAAALVCPQAGFARTARLVRRHDPQAFHVLHMRRGRATLGIGGRQTRIGAGRLVLVDSSGTYSGRFDDPAGVHSCVIVQLPRAALPLPPSTLHRLHGVPVTLGTGMGGALARWLADITGRCDEFARTDIPCLADTTASLVASVLGAAAGSVEVLDPEDRRRALRTQIRQFIRRHLADPLTPESIAAAHRLSRRSLYALFEEDGQTVAAWIRQERLERCRRDLADPRLAGRPIHCIAARWGFPDKAHFSRLFRSVYGAPPRDFRRRATPHGPTTTLHPQTTTTPRPSGTVVVGGAVRGQRP